MQIYSIYGLYRNNQIYLELNRCTIIYGEKIFVFLILKIFLAANAGSDFIFAEKLWLLAALATL